MKRSLLLLLLVHFFSLSFAQITINRADYTLSGVSIDSFMFKDISLIGLNIPQRGGNRLWDYTAISDSNITTKLANIPATVSALPPYFKDATFVPSRVRPPFGTYSIIDSLFRRLDSTGFYNLGYSRQSGAFNIATQTGGSSDSLWFLPRTIRFSPVPYLVKIPMTSTTLSKVMTIDPVPYKLKWLSLGYTSANPANIIHVRRVEFTTEVVGWGTLRLRNPVVGGLNLEFGVLFERYAELRQDSFYLNGAPMQQRVLDSFRLVQGKRDTTTIQYNLRGLGFRRGILSFVMSANEAYILSANRVIERSKNLLDGTRELVSNDIPLSIFPNPVTEGVNFEFDKKSNGEWHILIYNEMGQIIDTQTNNATQGKVSHHVNLDKSLPSGTYFVQIVDELSLIRSSGRFVRL